CPRRQHLRQSQHDRGRRRRAALRRAGVVGHRPEGRRTTLSAALRDGAHLDREYGRQRGKCRAAVVAASGAPYNGPMIHKLLSSLEELAPSLRASAPEADRLARLPKEASSALVRHGLLRLWIPRRTAGLELSLAEALQVYEAAACIDGSVGWAVMIGSGGGLFAAYLSAQAAHAIYSPAAAVIAGSGAPD